MNLPTSQTRSGPGPNAPAERRTPRVGLLRLLLLFEASTFLAAAAIHFGALLEGYEHRRAGTAETVTAIVLLAGLALTWAPWPWPRTAAVSAQAVAILGVLIGLFTTAVGVGPSTAPDIAYHLGILAVLVVGLAIALRCGTPPPGARHG
jgi:hypothetical protein